MSRASWDDFRIAYQLAESGTLTKAGKVLQMNHATVLRHINRLEEVLDTKLFIRHQRGYQLTDAGELVIKELPDINRSFSRLENLIASAEKNISGNLRITTLTDFSPLLNPALKAFRQAYPKLRIQIIATDDIIPLATGAAHVSLRAGAQPNETTHPPAPTVVHPTVPRRSMACPAVPRRAMARPAVPRRPMARRRHSLEELKGFSWVLAI